MKMNEQIGTIFPVKKNARYKLLELSDSYWIIDVDRNIPSFFLALFAWLLPQKAYRISQVEFKRLRYIPTQSDSHLTNFARYLLLPVGVILARFYSNNFQFKIDLVAEIKLLLLLMVFIVSIFIRIYLSKFVYQKRLINEQKVNLSDQVILKISPATYSKNLSRGFFANLFFIVLTILTAIAYFELGDMTILLILLMLLLAYPMLRNYAFQDGRYTIKVLK